jgi:hypothetical protein
VDGDTALIGAYGKSNLEVFQGAAYVFVRSGSVWTRQQELLASDGAQDDWFGISVSLSGNTAVIGADNKTIDSKARQGAAYVFVRNGVVWTQQQELTAPDGAKGDNFGVSVSVSGVTAVIGACEKEFPVRTHVGAAYVFVRSDGAWVPRQQLSAPATGNFGVSVAVDGNTTVIGNTDGFNTGSPGAAYVFVN